MKRVLKSPLFGVLIGLSMMVQAQPEFVEVVAESCELVGAAECHEKGYTGLEKCREALSGDAGKAGADTVHILATDQYKTRKPSLSGGMQVTDNTKMKAELYLCSSGSKELGAESDARSMSVEERLLRLNALKEKSLITEGEYQAARKRILLDL